MLLSGKSVLHNMARYFRELWRGLKLIGGEDSKGLLFFPLKVNSKVFSL